MEHYYYTQFDLLPRNALLNNITHTSTVSTTNTYILIMMMCEWAPNARDAYLTFALCPSVHRESIVYICRLIPLHGILCA